MSRFMRFSRVRLKDLENLAGVKDFTNSTSTAVAAAGQQTLLSHDLERAGQPRGNISLSDTEVNPDYHCIGLDVMYVYYETS